MPIDFTPSKRSVYFNTLTDNKYQAYSKVLEQGKEYLESNPFNIKRNINAQQKINTGLSILRQGIAKEKSTEKQYVQNLINNINDVKLKQIFSKQFKSIFDKNNFNYNEFINLINSILLGSKNYLSVLQLEHKRLNELDQAYKKLINTTNKTKEEIKDEKQKIRSIYLERHSMSNSEYSSFFSNITPTIDYLLAQYITNIANKIFMNQQLRQILKRQIIEQKKNNQQVGTYILNNVIEQINIYIPIIVQAALEDSAVSLEELLEKIEIDQFSNITINGEKVDFGIRAKSSKNIQINKGEKDLEKIINTKGNQLAKLLMEVSPNLNKNDKNNLIVNILNKKIKFSGDGIKQQRSVFTLIENLTEGIQELEKAQQQLKKEKKHGKQEKINTLINEIDQKKILIPKLKQRISAFVHKEIKNIVYNQTERQARILAAQKIKEILTPSIISITGPEYSEIIDNYIQQIGENFFSGPKNTKADTITIQLSLKQSKTKLQDKKILAAIKQGLKGSETLFYNTFQNNLPKAGQTTSYEQGRKAWESAVLTQKNKILEKIKLDEKTQQEQAKILQQIANQMKNSIVITETMKTFNQYNNDIGFLSGSLGSNIITQVENFSELFSKAGIPMTQSEQDWLVTALINCSPATIGTFNKQPLEKYLSLVAGFAIFDQGSAEIEMLSKQANEEYINYSPQIMHLYKLNGLYFPGSYVLQRIYDRLQKIITESASEIINNDGAVIRASASEALIGSHKQDEGIQRWSRVFTAAQDVTSITVAFMSGLLDIVDQLTDAFTTF